ncbi:MAG: hypothetical protein ABIP06_15195 [Pyrinomonadaceae bacterium]
MKVSIQIAQEKLEELIEKALNGEEVLFVVDDRNYVKLEQMVLREKEENKI